MQLKGVQRIKLVSFSGETEGSSCWHRFIVEGNVVLWSSLFVVTYHVDFTKLSKVLVVISITD